MSQPQPQQGMPPRVFSPSQQSPSPSTAGASFPLPPSKRAKISPGPPSQPNPPYAGSQFALSPGNTTPGALTPSAVLNSPIPMPASTPNPPNNSNATAPTNSHPSPYQQNGRSTPASGGLSLPTSAAPTPILSTPQPPSATASQIPHPTATFAPVPTPSSAQAVGVMGPPTIAPSTYSNVNDASRQAGRPMPAKSTNYEIDDSLANTGINLEEEEQYLNEYETRHGFDTYAPGGRTSFYGAGPMNQPAEQTSAKTQADLAAEAADRAWNNAARNLAISRTQDLKYGFIEAGTVMRRLMEKIAPQYGLSVMDELKPSTDPKGRMTAPTDFPKPQINVLMRKAPDGTVVSTTSAFLPKETYLADQLALLGLATKEHLRDLLDDANKIATNRQQTAHGAVPGDWVDAASPQPVAVNGTATQADSPRTGLESAVSPRTNPLKRSADEANGLPTPVSEASPTNFLADTMVGIGKEWRDAEEGRLKKRQKRLDKSTDKEKQEDGGPGSRTGSIAPGTPGSVAPESEGKGLSKKESKKAAAKLAEASNSTVNATLSLFSGKKGKKYSWMTGGGPGGGGGGGGSGASTPRPQAAGAPGTPAAAIAGGGGKAGRGALTQPGVHNLGQFREDSEKGKKVQLRDWVAVLVDRGNDIRALQKAYDKMDKSDVGDKMVIEKPA